MARKTFNHETFTFVDENGKTYNVYCYTTHTPTRATEHAETYDDRGYLIEGKDYWYNRPWYRFRYENALIKLARVMAGKNTRRYECFKACIDARAKSEEDACNAFFKQV